MKASLQELLIGFTRGEFILLAPADLEALSTANKHYLYLVANT